MIRIDGSEGEGGGQVLRSALALSMVTGQRFEINNIRAKRHRPGLLRQHLTAVRAAKKLCGAKVTGAEMHSMNLTFKPGTVKPGEYHFAVGTAGSAMLVMQTVLPAIAMTKGEFKITFEGGTHNHSAPPFEFIEYSFIPVLHKMGLDINLQLYKPGFYPAGGGSFSLVASSKGELKSIDLCERGGLKKKNAIAIVSKLPRDIAEREVESLTSHELWKDAECNITEEKRSAGPGNIVILVLSYENITETICGFGEKGLKSEEVARRAVILSEEYHQSGVVAGKHLADQLLLPMALSGQGTFTTVQPTLHTITNIDIIENFLSVNFICEQQKNKTFKVVIK